MLVTIDPHDGPTVRRDFRADEEAGMRAFIDRAQGRHNVYYHFNLAPPGASPPTKGEVPEGLCFHLDADLKDRPDLTDAELLGLIRAYEPPGHRDCRVGRRLPGGLAPRRPERGGEDRGE